MKDLLSEAAPRADEDFQASLEAQLLGELEKRQKNKMRHIPLTLASAVASLLIFSVLFIMSGITPQQASEQDMALHPVVIAAQDITTGTVITEKMISIAHWQESLLDTLGEDQYFTDIEAVVGQQTFSNIPRFTPITRFSLAEFSYGGYVQNLDDRSIQAMQQAGMDWVKLQINVGEQPDLVQITQDGDFNVLLNVIGDPMQVNDDAYFDEYVLYVAELAARGADAIEIWTEPNIDRRWITGDINPERYTELLRRSYEAIKSENPNTLVISAGLAATGAEAAFPGQIMNDDRFLREMFIAGAADYMDCIGASYVEGVVPPDQTSGDPRDNYYTRYLPEMLKVYHGTFDGSLPICFTELGYLSSEGYDDLPPAFAWAADTTTEEQAIWLDEAVNFTEASEQVRLVIVWNVNFTDNYPSDGYAIIRPDGSCPACERLGQ